MLSPGSGEDAGGLPRSQSGANPQHVMAALLGDYWLDRDEHLPSASLVDLVCDFGVTTASARAALSRLLRRGTLDARKIGRNTFYRLSARARARLEQTRDALVASTEPAAPALGRHLARRGLLRLGGPPRGAPRAARRPAPARVRPALRRRLGGARRPPRGPGPPAGRARRRAGDRPALVRAPPRGRRRAPERGLEPRRRSPTATAASRRLRPGARRARRRRRHPPVGAPAARRGRSRPGVASSTTTRRCRRALLPPGWPRAEATERLRPACSTVSRRSPSTASGRSSPRRRPTWPLWPPSAGSAGRPARRRTGVARIPRAHLGLGTGFPSRSRRSSRGGPGPCAKITPPARPGGSALGEGLGGTHEDRFQQTACRRRHGGRRPGGHRAHRGGRTRRRPDRSGPGDGPVRLCPQGRPGRRMAQAPSGRRPSSTSVTARSSRSVPTRVWRPVRASATSRAGPARRPSRRRPPRPVTPAASRR